MSLNNLAIASLRNIISAELKFCPGVNIFSGNNGSGKTSILEAIHLLGMGRSFRTARLGQVINLNADKLNINAQVNTATDGNSEHGTPIGLERSRSGVLRLQIAGDKVHAIAEMAKLLPIQLLNLSSYQLLQESAERRRRLLDWGVFHVEHEFGSLWKQCRRLLGQRNAALRQGLADAQITTWDQDLVLVSAAMHEARAKFIASWQSKIALVVKDLLGIANISIQYFAGWKQETPLQSVLTASLARDKALGYTQWGAQRADFKVFIENIPAAQYLSQGLLKGFMSLLQLTQAATVMATTEKKCLFLIDDLPSELDKTVLLAVIDYLRTLPAQIFMTCVEPDRVVFPATLEQRRFHVEHGQVTDEDINTSHLVV